MSMNDMRDIYIISTFHNDHHATYNKTFYRKKKQKNKKMDEITIKMYKVVNGNDIKTKVF